MEYMGTDSTLSRKASATLLHGKLIDKVRSVGTISEVTGCGTKRKTGQLTNENKRDEIQTD